MNPGENKTKTSSTMGTFLLQLPQHSTLLLNPKPQNPFNSNNNNDNKLFFFKYSHCLRRHPPKATINSDSNTTNGAADSPKPSRRGRKKKPTSTTTATEATATVTRKPRAKRTKKSEPLQDNTLEDRPKELTDEDIQNYDDGVDFYDDPPLICCFGAVQKEFVPTVRVHESPMHQDIYSQWKMLQWNPPEFSRAPGGPPSNVAVSHVRLGGRAAFMGKVGNDELGAELVLMMNQERVQTRAVKFDENVRTACSLMRVKFDEDGKMRMEVVKEAAENSLLQSELNLSVLKEARIFHFNSEVLTSPNMESTLFRAIKISKIFGGLVFFDLNLPLPLWKSRDETREIIKKAWSEADVIEVSRTELEFLLDEDCYERKRNYRPQYYAENYEQTRNRRDYHHYDRDEIAPLWHDRLKFLFVTDGTLRIHYYTPSFDGAVVGTEDVLITPFTCDRTGSGDAVVAAIMRKITTCPEMLEDPRYLS